MKFQVIVLDLSGVTATDPNQTLFKYIAEDQDISVLLQLTQQVAADWHLLIALHVGCSQSWYCFCLWRFSLFFWWCSSWRCFGCRNILLASGFWLGVFISLSFCLFICLSICLNVHSFFVLDRCDAITTAWQHAVNSGRLKQIACYQGIHTSWCTGMFASQ